MTRSRETEGLSPSGLQALKVTRTIPTGTYGLLRPSDTGTSTLIGILATLHERDEGHVAVEQNVLTACRPLSGVVLGLLVWSVSTREVAAVNKGCSGTLHRIM